MVFLLILVLYAGGGVTAEFKDRIQCESAFADLKKQLKSVGTYGGCYKKSIDGGKQ